MKISCIIPTCDRPTFLIDALKSVLNQTLKPYEIIIIDNGRETISLPDDLSDKVSLYNIVPYAGVSQARNYGAFLSRGDYLAFLDDDDLWSPEYLENVSKSLEKGAQCVISREDLIRDGKVTSCKNAFNKLTIQNILTFNPGVSGSNIVISKKMFYRAGGYDPKLITGQDKGLVLELLKINENVEVLTDNYIIKKIHSGPRQCDADKLAEGVYQFTHKYSKLMTRKQYLYNWLKILKYRYDAGNRKALFPYLLLKVIYKCLP